MSATIRRESAVDAARRHSALLSAYLRDKREELVDGAIQIAKDYGYAQYTTTIRAAWIEAIDSLSECIQQCLADASPADGRPDAEVDYLKDPRFTVMRDIAKRHRSIGVTFQLYLGLFKHFRNLHLDAVQSLPASAPVRQALRQQLQDFFDAAELSIGADWAEASENERLEELQAKARKVALDKDRYFSVFESLRDPAFLLNRNRRLVNANQAAAELFVGEASAGEIVYLTSMRGRRTPLEEVLTAASSGGDGSDRSVWLDTRRGPMCFDLREREIHDALENTKLGYVVILHDVTTHRRATEEAVRARRAMSIFLATMSHEIRTPLHGVLGATELLRAADGERHDTYVDAIETAGRHLLQTLNKVLDYSRLEARPPDPTPHPTLLRAVFEEYGHFASIWARRAEIPLSFSVARNLPKCALIDWGMAQQILTNLVSNAIRHDGGGGVTVAIRRCGSLSDGPFLRFEVLDSGPGIASDQAETLFEPFGARAPGTGGAGLGLAISRRLVEAMGGSIGFRNRRVGGAAFWFQLPYQRSKVVPNKALQRGPGLQKGGMLRCLVVDDDAISRMVTSDQLTRHGIAVSEAESVAAAKERAEETAFDAFLVDYHLSDGDGSQLVAELRRRRETKSGARFIALTANSDIVATANGKDHPFDALLTKPVAGEALLDAVLATAAASPPAMAPPVGTPPSLIGVPPPIVGAMAEAFTAGWDVEVAKLRDALKQGESGPLADVAHRVASSCAVMGISDLAGLLRLLETECRRGDVRPDLAEWRQRLDPRLQSAPERARALAAEHCR